MNIDQLYCEADLPWLANAARLKSGDTKTKKMNVAVSSVFDAEENPRGSMFPLRKRMIEAYSAELLAYDGIEKWALVHPCSDA